jgi:hypothetical protein
MCTKNLVRSVIKVRQSIEGSVRETRQMKRNLQKNKKKKKKKKKRGIGVVAVRYDIG